MITLSETKIRFMTEMKKKMLLCSVITIF